MRLRATLVALCALAFALPAAAQQPIVIKFSHVVAVNTPKGKAAEEFKRLAEERTKGRVKVEVYPNSSLFKDGEEMEALQLGSVQLLDKLDSRGIKGLAYWDNGFKVMSSNKSIKVPADYKGQKMRIQSSKVLDSQFRALGAVPQVMAFSEVYQALQTGVVDGEENTPSNIYTQKMHEVQKYLTVSDHGYIGYAVIANKAFWDGLPPGIRRTLEGAMTDATTYANDIAKKENDDALESIRKAGRTEILHLTPDEKREWKKALLVVHKEAEPRVGKDTIEAIYKAVGFDPAKL